MRMTSCDCCGKTLNDTENYDVDGYSKMVNVEIRNSRTYGAEYDICNGCYEKILHFAKTLKENNNAI